MASEGSFVRGELAYDEAQSIVDCTAPSEMQKKFAGEAGDSNCSTFAMIRQDRRIAPDLSNHDADCSLAGLIASDQMQRQPALNVGCSAVDVLVS